MTQSATVYDEGIIEEAVQDQGCMPATAPSEASVSETVGNLLSFMPAVADQFMLSIQVATTKLTDRVDGAEALTPHEIKAAKEEFIGAMLEAAGQLMSQREWLVDEIRNYDGLWQGTLLGKIKQTEAAVETEELRIRSMSDDDAVDLSSVMRSITALNEKKAYLNGLKFQMPNNIG